jgi:hypothetical protein
MKRKEVLLHLYRTGRTMKTSHSQTWSSLFLVLIMFGLPFTARSQSLNVKTPAPMHAGNNQATVDSFVGGEFWFFYAEPGNFHLRFIGGETQEGFTIGSRSVAAAAFAPKSQGATIKWKESASGTTFEGTVKQRTRVIVEVDPRWCMEGRLGRFWKQMSAMTVFS